MKNKFYNLIKISLKFVLKGPVDNIPASGRRQRITGSLASFIWSKNSQCRRVCYTALILLIVDSSVYYFYNNFCDLTISQQYNYTLQIQQPMTIETMFNQKHILCQWLHPGEQT